MTIMKCKTNNHERAESKLVAETKKPATLRKNVEGSFTNNSSQKSEKLAEIFEISEAVRTGERVSENFEFPNRASAVGFQTEASYQTGGGGSPHLPCSAP